MPGACLMLAGPQSFLKQLFPQRLFGLIRTPEEENREIIYSEVVRGAKTLHKLQQNRVMSSELSQEIRRKPKPYLVRMGYVCI